MDPRDKLKLIQQQRRKLQQRVDQIKTQKIQISDQNSINTQELLIRKKNLEQQLRRQEQYKKLQKELNERKKYVQRQKQMQRIKNQKKMIQIQAAMKKLVYQGLKNKVKGMNSQQIMLRQLLIDNDKTISKRNGNNSSGNIFKDNFESYLLEEDIQKLNPKYDIQKLNEKRLQYFQKKQQMVMRQILLKQLAQSQQIQEIDVMSLNKRQLQKHLQLRNIDFQDYMHPIKKQIIIENIESIQKQISQRLSYKKEQQNEIIKKNEQNQKQKLFLRQKLNTYPYQTVELIRKLIFQLCDQIAIQYQKRHQNLTQQQTILRQKHLINQYNQICAQNLVQQIAQKIGSEIFEELRNQMIRQSAQQVYKLNELAHEKSQQCFRFLFPNPLKQMNQLNKYKINLNFQDQNEAGIGKPKNDQFFKKADIQHNTYETQQLTTSLINDIPLLDAQQKYLSKIKLKIQNNQQIKTQNNIFFYDEILYMISKNQIKDAYRNKNLYKNYQQQQQIQNVDKIHSNWLLRSQTNILMLFPWGKQYFSQKIGGRISNACGKITSASFFSVMTISSNPCSVLIGFQKGQILKLNFNKNRITNKITNITQYPPIIQHIKSNDQPPFPLDNKNYITIQQQKPKPTDQIHQYRQFFEHHTEKIIFVGMYKIDKIISIDQSLKCALWQYNKTKGQLVYQPVFKFELKSTYQIYKQDQNPRYKDIYPTSSSNSSPQQMYKKYMLTQNFLKMQLYNNPKKQIAYFKGPNWNSQPQDKPIWKITYKQNRQQINKIFESYYNVIDGKLIGKMAKIFKDTIYILAQKDHVIRLDLKTINIYSWNVIDRRIGKIRIQIDMFRDQSIDNFQILPNIIKGSQINMIAVVNSGRILIFSLVSGQMLKNVNQSISLQNKDKSLYFRNILNAQDKGLSYIISNNSVSQLIFQDENNLNQKNNLNKSIQNAKRKYLK